MGKIGEIVGIDIHVVAVPWLTLAPMAVAEANNRAGASVFVINVGAWRMRLL